jgi:hypothetical protein
MGCHALDLQRLLNNYPAGGALGGDRPQKLTVGY